MTLLSTADIADLTTLDESAMNEQFQITIITSVPDGGGSSTTTESTTTTAGYFWSLTGDEAGADQIKATGKHRVALPRHISVPATAKITQLGTGKVYTVKYPFPVGAYSTSRIVGVEDV